MFNIYHSIFIEDKLEHIYILIQRKKTNSSKKGTFVGRQCFVAL